MNNPNFYLQPKDDPSSQPIATVVSRYVTLVDQEDERNKLCHLENVQMVCELAARVITECLHQFKEAKHLDVSFANILERDYNPSGFNGLFIITNHADDSGINAFRQGEDNYVNYTPRRVVINDP